jgi:pimeloyl-ACP methyl ester carboxylesterase
VQGVHRAAPPVTVPAIVLHGADDGFGSPPPEASAAERVTFPTLVAKRIAPGARHFLPHAKPESVAAAIIDVLARR